MENTLPTKPSAWPSITRLRGHGRTALVARAGPTQVTCHRAFDMTADPVEALETLIRCGIPSIVRWSLFTSHGHADARSDENWPGEILSRPNPSGDGSPDKAKVETFKT